MTQFHADRGGQTAAAAEARTASTPAAGGKVPNAHDKLPRWLGLASKLNLWLLRRGLRIGTQHVLTVRGRKTGRPRSTPVSVVTVESRRFIVSGEGIAWVANARAAGDAELFRAGRRERVRLVELPEDERGPILRAFWHQVPHGREFIARFFGLPGDAGPDEFEAAAPRCPVFEVRSVA